MGVIWSDFKGKTIEQPNNSHQILVRMLLNLDFFLFWKANWAPPTPNQRGRRRSTERGKKKPNDKYRNLSCETTRTVSLAENCLHLGTSSTVWSTKLCAAFLLLFFVFLMFLHIHEDVTLYVSPHRWTPPQTGPRRDELGSTRRRCPSCSTWNRGARGEW